MTQVPKKNVLLVDDDQIFNFINRKTLEGMSVVNDIHTALNGQQALDLINDYFTGAQSLPDIILLDLNMPLMDGFQFLEVFKKLSSPGLKKIKVVILTSSDNPQDIKRAKSLGIEYYLTKPVSEHELQEIFGQP